MTHEDTTRNVWAARLYEALVDLANHPQSKAAREAAAEACVAEDRVTHDTV